MKTLMKIEELYIDENNNSWSTSRETFETATEKSNSLIDCSDCINCINCNNCINCKKCNYCNN
jgi:hypothetical protein